MVLNVSEVGNISSGKELVGFFNSIVGGTLFWDVVLVGFALVMVMTALARGGDLKVVLGSSLFPVVVVGLLLSVAGWVSFGWVLGSWALVSVLSVLFYRESA